MIEPMASDKIAFVTDRQRRSWPWRLILIITGLVLAAVAGSVWMLNGAGRVTLHLDEVETGTLQTGAFTPEILINGTVVSETTVAVTALEGGAIAILHVRNGADVQAGAPIVSLSNPNLEREVSDDQIRLTRDIVSIESQITEMERQIVDAERAVRDTRFQLRQAESQLLRNQILEERGFASPAMMERLRHEVAYYLGEEQAALVRLETAQQTAETRVVRLEAMRDTLEALNASSRERLDNLTLRAPLDGQVAGLQARAGEPVQVGDVVFRISRGTADQISASVFESLARQIEPGARARLMDHSASVYVDLIEPEAENGAVGLRLAFESAPPTHLRPGQVVQLAVEAGETRDALLAPYGELVGPEHIWVVNAAGTRARAVAVQLGQRSSDHVEVLSDLEPGATIILNAPRPLDNLSDVQLRQAQ